MPRFDAYFAIDWSAKKSPAQGKDSIWVAEAAGTSKVALTNPRTRADAYALIRQRLLDHAEAGSRVLVGFDFAYGYPAGFADLAAPGGGKAWRRTWEMLSRLISDDAQNANNRMDVAEALNRHLPAPMFWGSGHSGVSSTHPRTEALPEWRQVEVELRAHGSHPQSVWKLSYSGSVGSQSLLGIPVLARLRDHPLLAEISAVWPFETGLTEPDAQIVHVELYPALWKAFESGEEDLVADARQVTAVVEAWRELDRAGALAQYFRPHAALAGGSADAVVNEEGWIFGAPDRPVPSASKRAAPKASNGFVFAAIAPHGAPVFDRPGSPTRKGMEELGRRFAAARPEAVIVLTPHGLHVDDHFAVVRSAALEGDASQWTEADTHYRGPGDPALAAACIEALREDGLPALGITFGSTAAGASTMPLDWGALIPLWFMRAPAVVVTPCRARSNDEHVRAGAALARATGTRRVALIASADHGHGHRLPDGSDGPYGFAAESAPYDARIQELVREDRLGELVDVDPAWATAALADSFWQLLMLHGGLGGEGAFEPELLSYEAPTYFGMLTAAYARKD